MWRRARTAGWSKLSARRPPPAQIAECCQPRRHSSYTRHGEISQTLRRSRPTNCVRSGRPSGCRRESLGGRYHATPIFRTPHDVELARVSEVVVALSLSRSDGTGESSTRKFAKIRQKTRDRLLQLGQRVPDQVT